MPQSEDAVRHESVPSVGTRQRRSRLLGRVEPLDHLERRRGPGAAAMRGVSREDQPELLPTRIARRCGSTFARSCDSSLRSAIDLHLRDCCQRTARRAVSLERRPLPLMTAGFSTTPCCVLIFSDRAWISCCSGELRVLLRPEGLDLLVPALPRFDSLTISTACRRTELGVRRERRGGFGAGGAGFGAGWPVGSGGGVCPGGGVCVGGFRRRRLRRRRRRRPVVRGGGVVGGACAPTVPGSTRALENKANHHAHHLRHLHGRLANGPSPRQPPSDHHILSDVPRSRGRGDASSWPTGAPGRRPMRWRHRRDPLLSSGRLHLTDCRASGVAPGPGSFEETACTDGYFAPFSPSPFWVAGCGGRRRASHADRSHAVRDDRAAVHRHADHQRRCDKTVPERLCRHGDCHHRVDPPDTDHRDWRLARHLERAPSVRAGDRSTTAPRRRQRRGSDGQLASGFGNLCIPARVYDTVS